MSPTESGGARGGTADAHMYHALLPSLEHRTLGMDAGVPGTVAREIASL
jgi:hypothetical protein